MYSDELELAVAEQRGLELAAAEQRGLGQAAWSLTEREGIQTPILRHCVSFPLHL